ncbi:6-phospho-beta-glucosidase [Actinopolymorpha sp. B17G11]|uniref:6-phospho-beta-glucosidase n=1 Tax=unclassified Actinopolymorpha TaxID=2627063 RepID=UPI0032D91F9D
MKLAILGGGGFRVPLVYGALLRDTGTPRVDEVALCDPSAQRLSVIGAVLARLGASHADPPRVKLTTDLDPALEGAAFVFSAIRVGGLAGRIRDERIALDLGVLGQETTGPGGVAYGLRTIPEAVRIAERVRAVAPLAYVINFTNPAGMITEAMQAVLGERVVGICDTPGNLVYRCAASLGLDPSDVHADYAGLNHLGWLRGLRDGDGRDRLPDLLGDERAMSTLEEGALFGPDWLRTLGAIPNEYLYYYSFTREAIRSIVDQPSTRGEFLARQQAEFYAEAGRESDRALDLWRRTIAEREALYMAEAKHGTREAPAPPPGDVETRPPSGYEGVALAVMAALARDEPSTMILDVRNGSTLAGLDDDAVIEVPARVDASGAHPLPASPPDMHQCGLIQQVKAVERLTIEAATTGSPDAAWKAFALHPLVDSVTVARDLLRGYANAFPEIARLLGQA